MTTFLSVAAIVLSCVSGIVSVIAALNGLRSAKASEKSSEASVDSAKTAKNALKLASTSTKVKFAQDILSQVIFPRIDGDNITAAKRELKDYEAAMASLEFTDDEIRKYFFAPLYTRTHQANNPTLEDVREWRRPQI